MHSISKKNQRLTKPFVGIFRHVTDGRQFSLRLKTLLDKKRVIQSRTHANSKVPANFVALLEGFQQFDGDLNKLQVCANFAAKWTSFALELTVSAAIRRDQRDRRLENSEKGSLI